MELMEKFEVAFALEQPEAAAGQPKEPQRWLIPELLPEAQPAAFAEFRQPGVKRLRFSYPEALPPGLLPRLIVRTHELSEAHAEWRWRSGVVLEWVGARALVRLDRNERRTEVAVLGEVAEDCQSLFDIIRAHLTVLHGKVPVIEDVQTHDDPEKWVPMTDLRVAERGVAHAPRMLVSAPPPKRTSRRGGSTRTTPAALKASGSPRRRGASANTRGACATHAHLNEKELNPFRPQLTHLSQQGYIQVWNDRDLVPGEQWEAGITDALQRADIVLLFYTTAARVSDFIQQTELPTALARSDAKQCTMLWVPLERNDLEAKHPLEQRLKKL